MRFRGFKLALRSVVRSGTVDTSRLTCRYSLAGDGARPLCGEHATWMLTAACAHEHVVPSLACDGHAEDARGIAVRCTECQKGREPHSCQMTVEFLALGDEARWDCRQPNPCDCPDCQDAEAGL